MPLTQDSQDSTNHPKPAQQTWMKMNENFDFKGIPDTRNGIPVTQNEMSVCGMGPAPMSGLVWVRLHGTGWLRRTGPVPAQNETISTTCNNNSNSNHVGSDCICTRWSWKFKAALPHKTYSCAAALRAKLRTCFVQPLRHRGGGHQARTWPE